MKRGTALIATFMLLFAMAAFAKQSGSSAKTNKAKSEVTRQATGTISSADNGKLVLTHKVKGKDEQTSFVMNDQTRKQGDLRSGEKATVHYKVENGENIATVVKAKSTSTASTSHAQKQK